MEEIILATNNQGKVNEIKEILKNKKIISLKEANINLEIEEDKETFKENALKKALYISKITNKACIADDSGLCIDILNGFPGVKTARFLGENATQKERNLYILNKLKGIEKQKRTAKVITCIAYVKPKQISEAFTGVLEGYIANEPKGDNGFGFDEIFELENGKTLAQLDSKQKNEISSRKIALIKLKEKYFTKEE